MVSTQPGWPGLWRETFSFSDSQSLLFPTAPAGDLLHITGHTSTIDGINAGAITIKITDPGGNTVYTYTNGGFSGNNTFDEYIDATNAHEISISDDGALDVTQVEADAPDSGLYNDVQFEFARVRSDGTTPDPFVPEPATWGLTLAGCLLVGFAVTRNRRVS